MAAVKKQIASWRQELQAIAKRHGGILKPEDVVEAARDPKSPLHFKFQWDDSAAAHQYRLWQARELIQVVVTVLPGTVKTVRAFVSLRADRDETGGGYRHLVSVLSDADMRKRLLAEALAEFDRWKEKYETLEELSVIFSARKRVV